VIKQNLQLNQFKNVSDGIKLILRNKGILGLYKGMLTFFFRNIQFSVI